MGIDQYFAEVLPENKAKLVKQLYEQSRFVCFIGDGINDTIALKSAQVSISLAEIELSILSRQCLERRIPDQEFLRTFVAAWVKDRNAHSGSSNWQFRIEDARIK